jgi:cyclophilin family peptidyl-prolyl cis-trans isomerase
MKSKFRPLIALLSTAMLAGGQSAYAQGEGSEENAMPSNATPKVVIHTSLGDITLELFAEAAPVSVKNFVSYAQDGFYDGTIFHRVISHFMIQGGGMTPDLKAKPTAEPIVNESANGISNTRGTIAMARTSDPDSATSQFFINVQDNPSLDHKPSAAGYAVFGKVVEGIEVVDDIRFVETASMPPYHDVPAEPVVIESVEIIDAG